MAKKLAHRTGSRSSNHHAHRSAKENSVKPSPSGAKKSTSIARHPKKHPKKPKLAK
jgi:hypothetical protein